MQWQAAFRDDIDHAVLLHDAEHDLKTLQQQIKDYIYFVFIPAFLNTFYMLCNRRAHNV